MRAHRGHTYYAEGGRCSATLSKLGAYLYPLIAGVCCWAAVLGLPQARLGYGQPRARVGAFRHRRRCGAVIRL